MTLHELFDRLTVGLQYAVTVLFWVWLLVFIWIAWNLIKEYLSPVGDQK